MTQKDVDRSREPEDPEGPTVAILGGGQPVRIPEAALRGHTLVVGQSGSGKSNILLHILAHRLRRKAEGGNQEAIVVIDPHGDLVQNTLRLVPPEVAGRVALLDFADPARTPGINPLDPEIFPDRDDCCRAISETLVARNPRGWTPRSEYTLEQALRMLHEFNSHPDTRREETLTLSEVPRMLEEGIGAGTGDNRKMTVFQRRVTTRVGDPQLKDWFGSFLTLAAGPRNQAEGAVNGHIGKLQADQKARMALEQAGSTLPPLDRMMSDGLVLLVNTAQGHVGPTAAALLGNALVSMVRDAARRVQNADCLLVCEEPALLDGTGWETMLRGQWDGNIHLLLTTQLLATTRRRNKPLAETLLSRAECLVALKMAPEDAGTVNGWMNGRRAGGGRSLKTLRPRECVVHLRNGPVHDSRMIANCLPPPEEAEGHEESIRTIISISEHYSRDRQEVRREIDRRAEYRNEDPLAKLQLHHPEDPQPHEGEGQPESEIAAARDPALRLLLDRHPEEGDDNSDPEENDNP